MIQARNVELRVGTRELLAGISFDIAAGEFVSVLGANGAGKTTLLRALAGLRPVNSGDVRIGGQPVQTLPQSQRSRSIAFITGDEIFGDRLTVREVVAAGRFPHHRWWQWREEPEDAAIVAAALRSVHLEDFSEREFLTLSSGEQQRVWIALALAQESPVLLLDEPTSHLDLKAAQETLGLLRAQVGAGKTVVCVLHDPNEAAAYSSRVLLLGGGTILAMGPPGEALSSALLAATYGVEMERFSTASGTPRFLPRHSA